MKNIPENTFFDINKLPAEKGLLVFGLSMNKLDHGGQTAKDCIEYIETLTPSKIVKPQV